MLKRAVEDEAGPGVATARDLARAKRLGEGPGLGAVADGDEGLELLGVDAELGASAGGVDASHRVGVQAEATGLQREGHPGGAGTMAAEHNRPGGGSLQDVGELDDAVAGATSGGAIDVGPHIRRRLIGLSKRFMRPGLLIHIS